MKVEVGYTMSGSARVHKRKVSLEKGVKINGNKKGKKGKAKEAK